MKSTVRFMILLLSANLAAQVFVQNPLLEEDREFGRAVYKDRLAGFMRYMADYGAVLVSAKTVVGKEEIEKELAVKFNDKDFRLGWEPSQAAILPSKDLGYSTGNYTFYGVYRRCNCSTSEEGNYVAVWKKQSDGSWKIAVLTLSKVVSVSGCGCDHPR